MKTLNSIFAVLLISSPVLAHSGPRIWIDVKDGKVATLTSDNDHNPTLYKPSRLFATELAFSDGIYTVLMPGFEVRRTGASVSAGTTFGFNIPGPLLYYDEQANGYLTTQVRFGPPDPGPVPQMAVSSDSDFRITGNSSVSGFDFFTYSGAGAHSHLSYTQVDGGANPIDGPAGIYALPINLTSTGLATSSTYYLLIGKGVSQGSPLFNEARNVAHGLIAVPGDADLDGIVDIRDLRILSDNWTTGSTWPTGDFNFGGTVDRIDLGLLARNWHSGEEASIEALLLLVPEPSASAWLLLVALLSRRINRDTWYGTASRIE